MGTVIDHELVNDLASAYRGKRMRDGIRDMEMAGMPEQVAERFYEALGEHADEVRGELHRIIEASGPCQCGGNCGGSCGGGSCDCGCGSDCPCMKSRVARRYVRATLKKPLLVLENKGDGFEVHVVEGHGGKFHVVLFDTEAQEYFPSVRAYPTLERAEAEAKKIIRGDGPGHARLAAKPVDMKKAVERLAQATEKAFKGQPGVGTTHVSLESKPDFEVGEVYINGGQYQIRIMGSVRGFVLIGVKSGPHTLASLESTGPTTNATKRLKEPVEFILKSLAQKAAKAAPVAPKGPSLDEVARRLRSIRLGPGGSVQSVEELSPTEWSVEPRDRKRLDHYGNRGEGWDDEGWQSKYAGPMSDAAEKWLDAEFGKGLFGVDVDEKGYVFIFLTADGKKHYGV